MEQNEILLRGQLSTSPEFSHENHCRKFYRFLLAVPRLSGVADVLPVIADSILLPDMTPGDTVCVTGQIRSHNIRREDGRHLQIFVFADSLEVRPGQPCNEVSLTGTLCREPTFRRTPMGREICDVMLAVPRAFRRADYLPCILWGRVALEASGCHTRDTVSLRGRLQSRTYRKVTETGTEDRIAYEISAMTAQFPEEPV